MRQFIIFLFFISAGFKVNAQVKFETYFNKLQTQNIDSGIVLTFDEPRHISKSKPTKIILFALPNGNTTAQSFGKILTPADDWHFDIQHIGAQTTFVRKTDPNTNYIVVYLENSLKSWPAWRRKYANADQQIETLITALQTRYIKYHPTIVLTGHSGGGSFIFGYINSVNRIPDQLERIGFLDATYAYESQKHQSKLSSWLRDDKKSLQVIAYNDSVVLFNGKPLVSPTGGTWYRSRLMAVNIQETIDLGFRELPDRKEWTSRSDNIHFSLIKNPEGKIYHTVLVEKNGFIHLLFKGTRFDSEKYTFWGERAYTPYILK